MLHIGEAAMEYTRVQLKEIFQLIPGTAAMYVPEGDDFRRLFFSGKVPDLSEQTEIAV